MGTTRLRSLWAISILLLGLGLHPMPAHAAQITWIGGNGVWTDNSGASNWNPADEPDFDDEAIFDSGNSVSLGSANLIDALTMSGGSDLATSGHDLTVSGLVQLSDLGTRLVIDDDDSFFSAAVAQVDNDAQIVLSRGTLNLIDSPGHGMLDINASGEVIGNGTVFMNDSLLSPTTVIVNDGAITASTTIPIMIGAPPAGTLAISSFDPVDARIDLDGISGNGVVNVFRNQTLDVNITLADAFSGEANLLHNTTLDIAGAWTLDSGTVVVDNGFVPGSPSFLPTLADVAYIRGGAFTQTGGTIAVVDPDGTLQFDAPFTQTGGTIENNGLVVFNANATIGAGANFEMFPSATSSITVNAGVTVNVDQPDFDADGLGLLTNVITVSSGGVLDLDLDVAADDIHSGRVNLNGGELDVTFSDGAWQFSGSLAVGDDTGVSQLNGDQVTFTMMSNVAVGENATLDVNADTVWGALGPFVLDHGAILRLDGENTFNGSATYSGAGTLYTGGNTTFDSPTEFSLFSGAVGLDGENGVANTITVNADTTINASTMHSFGNVTGAGADTLVLNGAADLTVNLTDPNGEWTLAVNGVLEINAGGGASGSGIRGSDFNMAGTATISGNSIWTARTDFHGTVTIAAGGALNLRGGDLVDSNRLVGGTIAGAGALRSTGQRALVGFGTIDADIEFANNSVLRADDGTLNVGGTITEVGIIGTADDDGVLDVAQPWNTTVANLVELKGGTLTGAEITNDLNAGISGHGMLSARVINNTRIKARGGTLLVESPGNDNDWDGTTNSGQLNALDGDITLHDNANFSYQGSVYIGSGHTVHATGFSLDLEPGSLLDLTGGMLRQTVIGFGSGGIGGEVVVHAGPDSTLKTDGAIANFQFEPTSNVTLDGNLRLDNPGTRIQAGATFTGAGRLINLESRQLSLDNGAQVGITVENRGGYSNSSIGVGQNDMHDFVQTATGTYDVDLEGTSVSQYDRLIVDGQAQLDGDLRLALRGGYVPVLGDTLDLISAIGGVTGAFSNVVQPFGMPAGLMFDVIYNPTSVQLEAISLLEGDYNGNSVVDAADYVAWRNNNINGQQGYNDWHTNFGRAAGSGTVALGSAGGSLVPEPATCVLAALIFVIAAIRRIGRASVSSIASAVNLLDGCQLVRRYAARRG